MFIEKPKPIMIGTAPFGVEHLIDWLIRNDSRFNENGAGIRAGLRIEDAIAKCDALPYIGPLSIEQHAILKAAAEDPSSGYPKLVATQADGKQSEMYIGRQILPMVDAISSAKDAPPPPEARDEAPAD